jgi:hypothetical protein
LPTACTPRSPWRRARPAGRRRRGPRAESAAGEGKARPARTLEWSNSESGYKDVRHAGIALCLWFAASQAVSLTDCCCGSICEHKNACSDCSGGSGCGSSHEVGPAHCKDGTLPKPPSSHDRCAHVEPQSDVDSSVVKNETPRPPVILSLLPIDAGLGPFPELHRTRTLRGGVPHQEGPPLYLRYEVLLI